MKLHSLMRSAADKAHDAGACCAPTADGAPDYPYGTCLYLDEAQLAQVGIDALPPAGAVLDMQAVAMVKGVREEQVNGELKRSLELQITDLGLGAARKAAKDVLYPGESKA